MIARATYYLRGGFSFRSAITKKKSSRSSRGNRRWRHGGGQKRKEVDEDYDDGGVHSGCRMEEVEALDAQAEGHDEGDGGVRVA